MQTPFKATGTDRCCSGEADGALPTDLKLTRPSLVEPLQPAEPWVGSCVSSPHILVLYLLNRPVALIPGTPFDRTSLNGLIFQMRNRSARQSTEPDMN